MRKLLLSLCCMLFMTGILVAAEYTLTKYDKDTKTATLKDKDGKEVTAKLTDKTKVNVTDKDGNKSEGKVEDVEKRWGGDKAPGSKVDVKVDGGNITEINIKRKGK